LVQPLGLVLPWRHSFYPMIDYSRRSYKKELLDRDDIPFADIQQNMKELNFINTYLGGHSITIAGFKKLLNKKRTVSVCEVGCGGGDNLNAIDNWAKKNKIKIKFTGIDINPNCITYAQKKSKIDNVNFITSDYKLVAFGNSKPDIIFTSLFCHHFTDDELIQMMKWMKVNCKLGFFINDLHRHPVAYHFIKITSRIFSSSYLVKNDAPLSVLRGFKKQDWKNIFQQAGIANYAIQWKWAFRYLITVLND
jgi:2-polyprenyl-3-methyl-5-hydroxy-6-metoxy-1,4-benzoquinol methylase